MRKDPRPLSVQENSLSEVAAQIDQMPVATVEKAIDDIAHHQGDELAKKILANLPTVKILAILRQHDFSSPSIAAWMLSPGTIVDLFKKDPLFWMNIYDQSKTYNFIQIQDNALDLIISLLANIHDRGKQGMVLQNINRDDLSRLYLLLPFLGWQVRREQTLFIEDPDIDFGTADHLYEIIRWAAPEVAEEILEFADSVQTSLSYYITDLWSEAFNQFDIGYECDTFESIMFTPAN